MTLFRLQPRACERAREWVSLQLDEELSELERALLRSHLGRCTPCAAYAAHLAVITDEIRTSELERLPQPIALPLRRRYAFPARALQAGAATAAVIAAAVGLGSVFGSLGNSSSGLVNSGRLPASAITSGPGSESDALVRAPRLAMLKAELGVGKQRGLGLDL